MGAGHIGQGVNEGAIPTPLALRGNVGVAPHAQATQLGVWR